MRAGQHTQRTVFCIGIIQVQSHRKHLLKQWNRRLHMRHALFYAPRAESRNFDLFLEGERQILMPGHQPVGFRAFVKVDAAHRDWMGWQVGACQSRQDGVSKVGHCREAQHPARACPGCISKHCSQGIARGLIEHFGHDDKSLGIQAGGKIHAPMACMIPALVQAIEVSW